MIKGLDAFLTTEPDNGYDRWCDRVFALISEEELPAELYSKHEDYIEELLLKLSMAGGNTFVKPSFAALVIRRRTRVRDFQQRFKAWRDYISKELETTKQNNILRGY